jgi:RNA polymerase sigma-70 factor (ECF subfamily)
MSTPEGGTGEDPYVTHRNLLFTVAYEMLGSAADAEDVLQESWLRWAGADQSQVRDPRAYLVRIVTRQALNHLRTVSRRREDYVGEWLPEPLLTSPDVADDVELAESVSIAMLTVLETLAPTERAVFVLREVFDVPYDEIAEAVDKSPAAVRQIAHRSRDHVAARRPRMRVDRSEHEEVVERLVTALSTGDLQALMDVLAPDVVAVADGGGRVQGAARRPVIGALRLARYLLKGVSTYGVRFVMSPMSVNGESGVRVEVDGELAAAVTVTVQDSRVTHIYSIANPDKLARLDAEMILSR